MPRILKIGLLIVLLLALPLRAVAGIAMWSCNAHHQSAAATVAVEMDAHCPHAAEHDAVAAQATLDDCKVCGDCCVAGVAAPLLNPLSPLALTGATLILTRDSSYPGFEPEGPDRPPRSTSR